MKALVLEEYNRLVVKEVDDPLVGPQDVLVQVNACGICGSDVHGMDGSTGRRLPPIVMGHEASGVIAEVGAEVAGWRAGERVTFDSTIYCGRCHFCRRGETNLCESRSVLGVSCEEYRRDGAFAEHVAVPARVLYRLPEKLSFEQAAMVEPLSVAVHAVERIPRSLGDTALVVGAGIIGLLLVQVLRAAGCGRIVATDLDPARLDLARHFGAEVCLQAGACDLPEEVRRLTGNRGADIGFDAVGLPATVAAAIRCVRKGGSLALVGNLSPAVELPLQMVVAREISLIGCYASRGEYPTCLDMIARGIVDTSPLISAVAPLAEGPSWFQRLHSKEPGLLKVILSP